MGSITKRGDRFYASFRDADGRRRMKLLRGALNGTHAKTLLAAIERSVMGGRAGLHEPTPEERARRTVTLRELAAMFLGDVEGVPGHSTPKIKDLAHYRRDSRSALEARVLPSLGSRAAASVTSADVERLRDALLAPPRSLAAGSVMNTLTVLSKLYSWAIRAGHVGGANPVRGVERPQASSTVDYLERAEVAALLAATESLASASPSFGHEARVRWPMVAAAVYAGLRKGELFGLRWQDLRLDAARMSVMRSYDGPTKSGKPRHLPLHPELARVLRLWKESCPPTPEGLVFPVEPAPGLPLRMGGAEDSLGLLGLFAAAGCHRPADGKPWHLLRHTFASHAVMSGTSLYEVQRLLGHSTPTMTQRYAHLAPEHLAGAVARLDFSQPRPPDVASIYDERQRRA